MTDQLDRSDVMYRAFADALPGVTWAASPEGELTFVGDRWVDIHGLRRDRALGDAWLDAVHPGDRDRVMLAWSHSLATGDAYKIEFRVRVADGSYRWFLVQALPVRDGTGAIVRWIGVNVDVDDRHAADAERERIESGLLLLARTGAAVVDSLDYQRTLRQIARAFVDGYASYCLIDFMPPRGAWERTAEHRDPAFVPILMDLSAPKGNHPIARAIEAGVSTVTVIDDAWARNLDATDRGHAISVLRVRSIICVPVITPSGDVIGALTCALDDASERENYGSNDLGFVQEVGRRAGAAIANVQLYERERRIAIEFQAASLPARLPDMPGVRLDAAYRPGSDEATIGGDWYDAFLLDDGRLVMTTGDVLGHGLHAAVSMTKLRLAMQSAAIVDADPRLMLRVAEATLRVSDPDAYATAIAAVYDPEARTLTLASAGHPPPIMRTGEGNLTELPTRGSMLGLGPSTDRDPITITLPAGATVVLYTDGLVEFKRELAAGVERLGNALRSDVISSDRPAEALLAAVLDGDRAQDDIAVLIACVT